MSKKPIYFDHVFEKHYQNRILTDKTLHELFKKALTLFREDPYHLSLHNHELKGKMSSKRVFAVDDDCRVIYVEDEDKFLFLDIGNHAEVYIKFSASYETKHVPNSENLFILA